MEGVRLTPTKAKDVLFSGVVILYDEAKKFGWIQSDLMTELFEGDCYIHKDVLAYADCQVGDGICFGIHLNNNGKPQASKPVFKMGQDGAAIGIENEGREFMFAEQEIESDPDFLDIYKRAIGIKSMLQNQKRGAAGPYGGGKDAGKSKGKDKGVLRGYGSASGGHGGKGASAGSKLTPTRAKDVLFVGVVIQYDDVKTCGWIQCDLMTELFAGDCYIHKNVMDYADCQVGDTIRFGIHLNSKGKPQASKPVFKVAEDGSVIGIEKEAQDFMFAEEQVEMNRNFLYEFADAINLKSQLQNAKKDPASSYGNGVSGRSATVASRGHGNYSASAGGYGGKGASSGAQPSGGLVDLKIDGIPGGVSHREISHIFRQYAGFTSLRSADKGTHTLAFASFETNEQAEFVMDALDGYVFDDQAPQWQQSTLSCHFSTNPKGSPKGSAKGSVKGKWK